VLNFILDHLYIFAVLIGIHILIFKLFVLPKLRTNDDTTRDIFFAQTLIDIINNDHNLVMYVNDSDGKSPVSNMNNNIYIKDPLRFEDDLKITRASTPHIFFDPKTLKVKGYFFLRSKETFEDKYAETVYEGELELLDTEALTDKEVK
jgi:hypothetical protein